MKHSRAYSGAFWILFILGVVFSITGCVSNISLDIILGSVYLVASMLVSIMERAKLEIQDALLDIKSKDKIRGEKRL